MWPRPIEGKQVPPSHRELDTFGYVAATLRLSRSRRRYPQIDGYSGHTSFCAPPNLGKSRILRMRFGNLLAWWRQVGRDWNGGEICSLARCAWNREPFGRCPSQRAAHRFLVCLLVLLVLFWDDRCAVALFERQTECRILTES